MFDSYSRLPFPDRLDVDPSDGGDSGESTPPLWPTSPHDTPSGRGHVLSPASRTQAILQGQRELMEMMRNIPESCYELSLKDLVELHRPPPRPIPMVEKRPSVDEYYRRRGQGYGNRKTTMTMAMERSGSMGKGQQQQEGLLLKMVLPVHTGVGGARGRRKQGKERSEEDCSEECWRKQGPDSESGDSLSSSTIGGSSGKSSGSGSHCGSRRSSNAIRHERRVKEGCCSFLRRKRR